jgi:uncharacterized membrane protein YfcA
LIHFITVGVIGIMIGLLSGLFGLGGALVATPLLKIFAGLSPLLALATPLPAAIPSAISGSIVYYRNKLIDFKIALIILLCAIPMNYIGVEFTKHLDGRVLMILTGALLFIVGGTFFVRGWLLKEEKTYEVRRSVVVLIPAGVLAGFLSGLLAIGGGIVLVPVFVRLNRLSLKSAMATSLFCVLVLSLVGTIKHYTLGNIDIKTALILSVFAVPFSYYGAKMAIKLRNQTLERMYGTFVVCFAIYFLINVLSGK